MTRSRTSTVGLVAVLLSGLLFLIPQPASAASPARQAKVMTDADLDGVSAAATLYSDDLATVESDDNFSDSVPYWSLLAQFGMAPKVYGQVLGTTFSTPTSADIIGMNSSLFPLLNPGSPGIGGLNGGNVNVPWWNSSDGVAGWIGSNVSPSIPSSAVGTSGNPVGGLGNVLGGLGSVGQPVRIRP